MTEDFLDHSSTSHLYTHFYDMITVLEREYSVCIMASIYKGAAD